MRLGFLTKAIEIAQGVSAWVSREEEYDDKACIQSEVFLPSNFTILNSREAFKKVFCGPFRLILFPLPNKSFMKNKQIVGYFQEEPLSFEYPASGAEGAALLCLDVPEVSLAEALPQSALRQDGLSSLPQLSEFDVVRHFTRLSKKNLSIDANMYPLGSCTMKYNPRLNEVVARYPGFSQSHPLLPDELVQGNLALLYQLEQLLLKITGFDAVSLQPAAGAQGELVGILMIRAYHQSRGENRKIILVPDSAHGTNPSSAAIAGYTIQQIKACLPAH